MTEREMQQELLKFLGTKFKWKTKFKWAKITSEFPFFHGTADILFQLVKKVYIFELKLKINRRLINQCENHKKVGDYIFAVAYPPKKENTKIIWENEARENNINLLWMDNLKKSEIKKGIKNTSVNKEVRKIIYGI